MAPKKGAEKRKHPRVDSRVPIVTGGVPGERFEMESLNLSLDGVYCITNRFVPVMTKLKVTLDLPELPGREPGSRAPIEAEAIVVRIEERERPEGGKYSLAMFFSQMKGEDRIQLAEFLDFERKSRPEDE